MFYCFLSIPFPIYQNLKIDISQFRYFSILSTTSRVLKLANFYPPFTFNLRIALNLTGPIFSKQPYVKKHGTSNFDTSPARLQSLIPQTFKTKLYLKNTGLLIWSVLSLVCCVFALKHSKQFFRVKIISVY